MKWFIAAYIMAGLAFTALVALTNNDEDHLQ